MGDVSSLTALSGCAAVVLGYIDPGIVSAVIQGLFVLIFGAAATYLLAPWRWIQLLWRRKREGAGEARQDGVDDLPPKRTGDKAK